jgi:DNA primase
MMDDKLLEELKARFDIVDVISDHIELKRAGQNYKGLCPFHPEKTPSFMVSPDKQIFHCFGCGVGGNLVNFVMKYENLSFIETVRLLAKKAGISLKEQRSPGGNEGLRERLLEIHAAAAGHFAENLKKSKTASAYLRERGLTEETIRIFSLGYALREWNNLSNYLKEKGFSDSVVVRSGVISKGEKGIYDTFRNRIMFPIHDVRGGIIAFGGRVMDDSQPKYLNSPESPLFRKGETLYGLNLAREGIRKTGYSVIGEGYLDVIMCHQCGFNNAVAPLGTALTAGHLRKLGRFTKKAVLVFDGDAAGQSAARRALPILLGEGFSAKILLLPPDDDPDSFLRKEGAGKFAGLIEDAKSPMDFIVNTSKGDRTEAVHEALEAISTATDVIMKEGLIRELSEKTGVRETVLREELKRMGKKPVEKTENQCFPHQRGLCYDEELLLLSAVIAFPEKLAYILQMMNFERFRNPTVRGIFEKFSNNREGRSPDAIISSLENEEEALVARLTFDPGFDPETVDRNIEDCIRIMSGRGFDERRRQIHEKIREAEKNGDQKLLYSLLQERQRLIKEER